MNEPSFDRPLYSFKYVHRYLLSENRSILLHFLCQSAIHQSVCLFLVFSAVFEETVETDVQRIEVACDHQTFEEVDDIEGVAAEDHSYS